MAPKQALDGLTDVIKLPSLVDTSPAALCKLHVPEGKTLEIAFNAVAANIPAEAAFLTERKDDAPATWLISYTPNLSGSPSDTRVLAEVAHAEGELTFGWRTPIEDAQIRKELSNCLITLACENVSKTALLRAPIQVPRLPMDLNREVNTHTLAAVDLPKEESLRLEIAELTGFPAGAVIEEDRRVLRLKERTTIAFTQFEGAKMQLEFRRVAVEDLQIVVRPEFYENKADKFAMTLPRLLDLKAGMEKAIPEGEARIVALGKELKAIDKQLKDLGPRPGGAAFVAWQSQLNKLQSAASSCRSQISRLQRRLPEMRARLANVPVMQRFLSELHQRGTLKVKVYAECGDAKLVVIDAALDPASASQQPGTGSRL